LYQKPRRCRDWELFATRSAGGGGTGTALDMPSRITRFHGIDKCRMCVRLQLAVRNVRPPPVRVDAWDMLD
jgi:hypothetical protein